MKRILWLTEPPERLPFNLPDALSGQSHDCPNLFKCLGDAIFQPKTQPEDLRFARHQLIEHPRHCLIQINGMDCLIRG